MKKYTQSDAVLDALEILGDLTSLVVIQEKASEFYGGNVNRPVISTVRKAWREANGLQHDCRTYATQPRRNILKDDYASLENQVVAQKMIDKVINNPNEFLSLVTSFHSIEHMVNCLNKAKNKKKRKKKVA